MKDSWDPVEEESKTLTVQRGVIGELNIKTHRGSIWPFSKFPFSTVALVSPITADHEDSLALQLM